MKFDGFEWDEGNREKCQKHGVLIEEIENLFFAMPLVGPDPAHSAAEERFRAIGVTAQGRSIFVVFTLRHKGDELLIRALSARYMHNKEVEAYEKTIPRV